MQRKASAVWQGGLKDGKGSLTTDSKVLSAAPYSFGTRFEGTPGTNPEELLAAAHAGCFSMALSMILGEAGIKPERIDTTATVTFEKLDTGFTITKVHLDCGARAGRRPAKVEGPPQAKSGCPVTVCARNPWTRSRGLILHCGPLISRSRSGISRLPRVLRRRARLPRGTELRTGWISISSATSSSVTSSRCPR